MEYEHSHIHPWSWAVQVVTVVTQGYMNRSFCTASFELMKQHAPLVMQPHLGGGGVMGPSRALGGQWDLYGSLCGGLEVSWREGPLIKGFFTTTTATETK